MTLLSRTKEIAKKRGMSMESLANKVGISKSGIYQWDKHEPKPSTIQKVADVLHVSTDYLLGRTDEMNPSLANNKQTEVDIKKPLNKILCWHSMENQFLISISVLLSNY